MNQALYRKYRPQKFGEVLGQDHIVSILKGAVESNRVGHAYLFSGPRGTGKTSVARILAKDVGCHEYDLLEIDAASSRGIDEIRSLREGVYVLPLRGSRKVYIIDEAHMLTKEAFNALLKTLEEPPEHVIFMLATTEPEKLPDTIISRCQQFNFKKIPENILQSSLIKIAQKEGFEIDKEGAGLIAFFSDGSFRDSQTLLDQLFSLGQTAINGEQVRKFLSAPSKSLVENFVSAVLTKNTERGMGIIQTASEQALDMQILLKLILRKIRFMLLLKLSPQMENQIGQFVSSDELNFLKQRKETISVGELGFILVTLLEAHERLYRSQIPQLPLELALAKIHLKYVKK